MLDINITYQEAMAAQHANKTFDNPRKDPLAGKELEVTRNGEVFKLSFSDEMIEFKKETADFLAKDVNVLNADPSDIFSYRLRDQWLVFSQYLHDANFFDSLSNEEMMHAKPPSSTLQMDWIALRKLALTSLAG